MRYIKTYIGNVPEWIVKYIRPILYILSYSLIIWALFDIFIK